MENYSLFSFSSDITEKALNAIRLTRSTKNSKNWILEFNIENSAQFWSEEHYKIFLKFQKDQPKEKLYELYRNRIHPDDLATLDYYMQRALNEGVGFCFIIIGFGLKMEKELNMYKV